ncbi:ABC transporter substrate-binding protein [Granulicella sibirica]|uniref:Vitamin B12 ABC transporter, B12-binding component BtuF n=1 Tax=Granulicella sibirica TaxID=2479048 RepID=A0A4Q0T377_9BACT|nr:cobalamin-binding protein [Granulicella sibirica]RXH56920.1 Vitamin B12 ABC transporter, B12-binding component BtuF [Granulicella sibirica]
MKTKLLLLLTLLALSLQAHATRTVTDETGRAVQVPDHPHRIISLVPSVTDAVYSIGAGDDVVAVSDYVQYPAEAKKKPSVGSILTPSLETIVSLHPDLLLAMKTQNGEGSVEKFRQLGIPIFLIDPHGIDGIFRSILSLGDALNRRPQADAEVASLRQRLAAVRAGAQGKPVVTVFLPVWYDPVITIGHGAFITEMIAAAGARSVTADIPQEWPHISIEAVIARAPDALLLTRGGKVTLELLKTLPGWQSMPAVTQAKVFYVDKRMDFASPVAFDALEDLAKQFHP